MDTTVFSEDLAADNNLHVALKNFEDLALRFDNLVSTSDTMVSRLTLAERSSLLDAGSAGAARDNMSLIERFESVYNVLSHSYDSISLNVELATKMIG